MKVLVSKEAAWLALHTNIATIAMRAEAERGTKMAIVAAAKSMLPTMSKGMIMICGVSIERGIV
jgi:hypothetical protein